MIKCFVILALWPLLACGQTGAAPAQPVESSATPPLSDTLTDESVVRLVRAGLGEEAIVQIVNGLPGRYALNTESLVSLKQAGVSDKIIAAMVNRNAGGPLSIQSAQLPPAAGSPWKEKPISQWNKEDAAVVFSASPWVKYETPQRVPDSTNEAVRRDSGDWQAGRVQGLGLAALLYPGRAAEARKRALVKPAPETVVVRWESALPIRDAEQKIGMTNVPLGDENHYAIVVYGIPILDPPNRVQELKDIAFIQRDKKKNLKPSSVKIFRLGDGTANVVYLFPRSIEITKKDGRVRFIAQIGRLFLAQDFYTEEMQIRGTLEL
jgi:hypothetical protein